MQQRWISELAARIEPKKPKNPRKGKVFYIIESYHFISLENITVFLQLNIGSFK